jgi:transcription termination factor Rho
MTVRRIAANPGDHRCMGDGGTSAPSGTAECDEPSLETNQRGKERKSVTDTDLFTAGGSDIELPDVVNSDISEPVSAASADTAAPETPQTAPASAPAETAPAADVASGERGSRGGSLTGMVLPDLRALANQLGVKGSSGMRKSELIAAIKEHRGEANGRPAESAAAPAAEDQPVENGTAPAAEQSAPPRRERRGASRQAGTPAVDTEAKADNKRRPG